MFPGDFCENRKSFTALGLSALLKCFGLPKAPGLLQQLQWGGFCYRLLFITLRVPWAEGGSGLQKNEGSKPWSLRFCGARTDFAHLCAALTQPFSPTLGVVSFYWEPFGGDSKRRGMLSPVNGARSWRRQQKCSQQNRRCSACEKLPEIDPPFVPTSLNSARFQWWQCPCAAWEVLWEEEGVPSQGAVAEVEAGNSDASRR